MLAAWHEARPLRVRRRRFAMPTWQDEQDVRSGKLVGTMWGVMTPEEAADIEPEPHRWPRRKRAAAAA